MELHPLHGIAGKMYSGTKPVRDEKYKAFIRQFPCIACGSSRRLREAMHIGPHGMGQKASDLDTLPGCRQCHQELHRIGPKKFQAKHGLDFTLSIQSFRLAFVELQSNREAA